MAYSIPTDEVREKTKGMLVVEMNMGQMLDDVIGITKGKCPVKFYGRAGGPVPMPEEILAQIENMVNDGIPTDVHPRDVWYDELVETLGLEFED